MITANSPLDPHWRARLVEIQDQLLVAHDVEDVTRAFQQLVAVLTDEWGKHEHPEALLQLVSEAYAFFTNPEARLDLRDWIRAAEPFVKAAR